MRKNEEVTLPRTGCGDGCVINGHGIGQQCGSKESKTCEEKTGWLLEIKKLVEQYLKK